MLTGTKDKTKKRLSKMGLLSLVVLIVQNTSLVLLMRYSLSVIEDGPRYYTTTSVVIAEILKVSACLVIIFFQCDKKVSRWKEELRQNIFLQPKETLKLAIPAGVYAVQNNLLYIALTHLDSSTYQVTYQLKLLTTALFSVAFLGRSLSLRQWTSLLVLMTGVILVQFQLHSDSTTETTDLLAYTSEEVGTAGVDAKPTQFVQNPMLGLFAVLCACFSSGFAGVYFEKLLKESKTSVWMRNIQLGLWGTAISLFYMFVNDGTDIGRDGFFYGYDPLVWTVVLNQAFSGLVVAAVIKYADSILKGFAVSLSIIIGCVLSIFIFDFAPTIMFLFGSSLVVGAVFMYSS